MPLWDGFIGPTYQALSSSLDAEEAINIYAEKSRDGNPKSYTFYGTPGLLNVGTAATLACRGQFNQNGIWLIVIGDTLYTVDGSVPTALVLTAVSGTITNDGLPVFFCSNGEGGDQIGIVGGGELKVYDTVALTLSVAIVLPFADPGAMVFIDGYGVINQLDSPVVWFSALEDFTSWDALDFFTRSGTADNVVGLAVSKSRVWVLGEQTTTLFYDSGDSDTPFLPFPESVTQWGLVNRFCVWTDGDIVTWLARKAQGTPQVVRAVADPSPSVVSTPPIDLLLASVDCSTAEMGGYSQAGHTFACLTVPQLSGANTLVFDATENLWQKRAGWDTGLGDWVRWRSRGLVVVGGDVYAGDYQTGDLYSLDLDVYDDDGDILRRLRRAPYLSSDNQFVFIDQIELGMQAGVGVPSGQGSDPVVTLRISRDGAHSWDDAGFGALGPIGDYDARCYWAMLGRSRSDRLVLEVSQTDPVKCVWGPGLYIRFTKGTGQL